MKSKAVLGGTFNPFHKGHLHLAYAAIDALALDSVIFIPSGKPPHKTNEDILDGKIRYEIIKTVIKNDNRLMVSDFELINGGYSFTYKTMEHFKASEPDTSWFFLLGADCLLEINTWRNVGRIMNSCTLAVFMRKGFDKESILYEKKVLEEKYNKEIILIEAELPDISSTTIRSLIRNDEDTSMYLPKEANNFIIENNLYRD
ncbi:MAG TPA: nicotinate-nucleotide adenylyltransferase [Clostridiaceae bacterium]